MPGYFSFSYHSARGCLVRLCVLVTAVILSFASITKFFNKNYRTKYLIITHTFLSIKIIKHISNTVAHITIVICTPKGSCIKLYSLITGLLSSSCLQLPVGLLQFLVVLLRYRFLAGTILHYPCIQLGDVHPFLVRITAVKRCVQSAYLARCTVDAAHQPVFPVFHCPVLSVRVYQSANQLGGLGLGELCRCVCTSTTERPYHAAVGVFVQITLSSQAVYHLLLRCRSW